MQRTHRLIFCLLFISLLSFKNVRAQLTLTPDTVICLGSSIELNAYISGAINTSHYTFQSTPYTWDSAASPVSISNMNDDEVRGPFNIGFTFSFLCANYTQFYVSSNGWISFGTANGISWNVVHIPSTNTEVPKNAILGPWEDWDPTKGGQIFYGVSGTTPNRKLIVSWVSVPMFACNNLTGTFQIELLETSNQIQDNIVYKPSNASCNSTTGLYATQGIHNMAGDLAFVAPGRNATLWTTTFESTKFIPDIDTGNILWFQSDKNSPLLKTWHGKKITVTPDTASVYTASLTKCNGDIVNETVHVNVIPGMTSSLLNSDTSVCNGRPVLLRASATGGKPSNYHFYWINDNEITTNFNFITHPTASENYQLIVTDYCSVPDTHSVNIHVSPPLRFNTFKDTTICFGSSIDVKPITTGGIDSLRYIDWGSTIGNEKIFYPIQDTVLHLLLKDNCTYIPDTANINVVVRRPLFINTISDTTLCFGDTLKLTTIVSGGDSLNYKYTWNNGIGNFPFINFVPDSSRKFKVVLTDGCTPKSDSDEVNIRVRRAPKILLLSDSTICKGQSIVLFAQPIKGDTDGVTFLWDNGIGLNNFIKINPDTTTKYTVLLNDRCLLIPETDSVTVKVRAPLTVAVRDTLICYGNTLNIISIGSGGKASTYKYKWSTGAIGDTLFNISPRKKTTYKVVLSDNCTTLSDSAFVNVDVRAPLVVKLPLDTVLCAGRSITIPATSTGGIGNFKYKWDGINSTDSFKLVLANNDKIVIVEISDGCSLSAFDTMKVVAQPFPKVDFIASQLSDCGFAQIDFKSNSKYSAGSSFKWDFKDGAISNDSVVTHEYKNSGNFNVKLSIVSSIGCADSISKNVSIFLRKAVTANFTSSTSETDIINPTINFISLSADTLKHSWTFGTSGITSSSMYPSITFKDTGNYLVSLIVRNVAGCRDTMNKWVRVDDVFKLFVPNSFTPNNDGLNDVFKPIGRGVKDYFLTILDRGGNIIFESDDMKKGWDGQLPDGNGWTSNEVVYYKISTVDVNYKFHVTSGTITVLK